MNIKQAENITKFKQANLSKEIKETLAKLGFKEATEIQSVAIPPILEGRIHIFSLLNTF